MPLFSTPTQFAALGLVLIAGWLLGLASHPGGKKWKARYLAERDAHGATRKETDLRASAAEQRAVEAEHENARLVKAAAAAPVAAPVARTTAAPVSRDRDVAYSDGYATCRPGYATDGTKRGWFDFNQRR
ncbi:MULTISPECIES: hypothetical protein [Sphingomonas]|uniref:hypothetical protein n=1 Tax=Sphingomonas TaxID=13687 RepID=UPI0006F336DC|nr:MULTISPECIES: hypothetical protein [Sphingomonas]KQM94696.1 hypothetical protein ASE77_03790 [Sphingomonas sp. Leaf226]MDY0968053.1 hypothetical protein [Sphingomonas sp. CFBP9021]USR01222.1 hypothetical protein NEF64_05080 [Sphingomonas aerolata]